MSNTQYIFLQKSQVPARAALQAVIDSLGFPLQLDQDFTPFTDSGFSPCTLLGTEGPGFEISYESAQEIVSDEEWKAIAAGNDYCVSLTWRSSEGDLACVAIVSAAFATAFGAIVSYEGEAPESTETLLEQAKTSIEELLSSPEEQAQPQVIRATPEAPRTIEVTIEVGGKTFNRTYKGGERQ